MNSIRVLSQRVIYAVAAFAMVIAIILPAIASAAQVSERSIQLSSASVAAKDVTYGINFTADGVAAAFAVDFCSNTPLIGQPCTAPAGFDASAAASTTSGFTTVAGDTNRIVVTGAIGAAAAVSVEVTGIDNPTVAGPLYARVVTFDTAGNADISDAETLTGKIDEGGVAMSITPTIGVSGTVLETITFCVSKVDIPANCATTEPPVVELGEDTGGVVALTPGTISEDSIFTQISTNAASGAVVRLKSNATDCGGLLRAGATPANTCDILPALDGGIDAGANEAKFGVKTTDAENATGAQNPTGSLIPATGSFYNNTTWAMNFIENNTTGVTSPFGDPFLETEGDPVTGQNMEIKFGATVSNKTPAGAYSADLSLIAVGKF